MVNENNSAQPPFTNPTRLAPRLDQLNVKLKTFASLLGTELSNTCMYNYCMTYVKLTSTKAFIHNCRKRGFKTSVKEEFSRYGCSLAGSVGDWLVGYRTSLGTERKTGFGTTARWKRIDKRGVILLTQRTEITIKQKNPEVTEWLQIMMEQIVERRHAALTYTVWQLALNWRQVGADDIRSANRPAHLRRLLLRRHRTTCSFVD